LNSSKEEKATLIFWGKNTMLSYRSLKANEEAQRFMVKYFFFITDFQIRYNKHPHPPGITFNPYNNSVGVKCL